ncbi:MAG: phosphoglycerate dehydrogenase [Oscillospiraceae bacterium]|nr:phosphoglycerate dehydrogenase [Oscillospiraceae bacterium]
MVTYKIKTLNKISDAGVKRLYGSGLEIDNNEANPAGIVVRSAAMHDMEFGSNLRAIARAGAGVNNIPVDRCTEEGIIVFNTPGANANAVKELAVCALMLASRDVAAGIQWAAGLTDGETPVTKQVESGKGAFVGPEISGKTLGIIGLGAIGCMVANAAVALGMSVVGYDPYLSVTNALHLNPSVLVVNDAKMLYEGADYISIHVPYSEATRHTIKADTIALMKNGVRIINLARGELVNDEDIIAAIEAGKVARYVTDFPNSKLVGVKGIVAIPHLGASTPESEENCAVMAVDELKNYLLNGNIRNSVNFPNVEMERSGVGRITIIHKNIPNMLSTITSVIAADGLNIEASINRSKKDVAYTIIDVPERPDQKVLSDIWAIPGVMRVRNIKT